MARSSFTTAIFFLQKQERLLTSAGKRNLKLFYDSKKLESPQKKLFRKMKKKMNSENFSLVSDYLNTLDKTIDTKQIVQYIKEDPNKIVSLIGHECNNAEINKSQHGTCPPSCQKFVDNDINEFNAYTFSKETNGVCKYEKIDLDWVSNLQNMKSYLNSK